MKKQVFLGGACGHTTWRRALAIPALAAAGVSYVDPQLDFGAWTTAREADEMRAKDEADVLLFVINGETRGVASVAEAAYLLAARRPLALVVTDVGDYLNGQPITASERDDLNRGRIFVRTMAACHDVPVFTEVRDAVQHAITLVQSITPSLSLFDVKAILAEVQFHAYRFIVTPAIDGFLLQLEADEPDVHTGVRAALQGRQWHVSRHASKSEIVQTAFKAVATWQEHEAREHFRYQGAQVFGPHFNVERLAALWRATHEEHER
ncbi:MAG: hypothetical protein HOP19_22225 [Acidobacteria bacterium]|nr:hypothetical protein [Acidobacteriota bacterium]